MFIFQRIFGEIVFMGLLLLICLLINKSKSYQIIKKILIVYLFFLCLISYIFKPVTSVDLIRLQASLDTVYKNLSITNIFDMIKNGNITNYTTYMYFFLISQIGNPNLLQTFATLIFYSILFYVIYDYSKIRKLQPKEMSKILLFLMLNGQFVELISGIRTLLGFSIIFLCIYREFFKEKSFLANIYLYIIAIGFHNAVIPIFLIRIFFLIVQKEKKIILKIINILLFLVITFFTFRYGITFIESAKNRADLYLNNNIYIQYWEYYASFVRVILILYVSKKVKKYNEQEDIFKINRYIKFVLSFCIFDLAFFYEYTIFHRYSVFTSLLSLPIIIKYFEILSSNINIKLKNKMIFNYYMLLLIIVALCFGRGNMTELTFWN